MSSLAALAVLEERQDWIFAKTLYTNPHSYTLRKNWGDDQAFENTVLAIRQNGGIERFGRTDYQVWRSGPWKYWTMGYPAKETLLINRKVIAVDEARVDVSIEYSHIYTNQEFSAEHASSIEALGTVLTGFSGTFQTVVMVDDYSPGGDLSFDYRAFLDMLGASSSQLIRESQLLASNNVTLSMMRDAKMRRQLEDYIERKRYPCSLFIASWYLSRLGVIPGVGNTLPARRLINILPRRFETSEQKARRIIQAVAGADILQLIEYVYLDGDTAEAKNDDPDLV